MTAIAKKILITTERHEVFVIRTNGREAIPGFCPICARDVEMLTFDSAISLSGIRGRDLMRESETGEVHSVETSAGHLLICTSSLAIGSRGDKR